MDGYIEQSSNLPRGLGKTIVNSLGLAITAGRIPVGETLPVEQELADQYNVSRTALRDAIKVLAGKGLIRTARRYGTRVCDQSEWNMLDPDVVGWRLADRSSYIRFQREISEFRLLVEPGAAALAAERATKDERSYIVSVARKMSREGGEEVLDFDLEFHLAILRATHNSMIAAFEPSFRVLLSSLFRAAYHSLVGPHRYDPNPEIHVALAVAIEGGRSEEARHISTGLLSRGNFAADALESDAAYWARPPSAP